MEWMILPYRRYFDFSGRSRRLEYWMFTVFCVMVVVVMMALILAGGFPFQMLSDPENVQLSFGPLFWLGFVILGLFWLGTLIPGVAVIIGRLHDRDMSGWWYLGIIVASMIPIVNFISGIAFIVLMFLPGTPGPNRFGPDPKDPASAEVFA